jgi:hypothetical protein
MPEDDDTLTFFLHVMKTAGTSFLFYLHTIFPPEVTYPARGAPDTFERYWHTRPLLALSDDERRRLRLVTGHLPFAAAERIGADRVVTILRDPVERTWSHLRQMSKDSIEHRDWPLERIYDDFGLLLTVFQNYQVRQFAWPAEDCPGCNFDVIGIDDVAFERAVANLDRVDVVGFTDRYDQFLDEVTGRFGWPRRPAGRARVSDDATPVPAWFRRRMTEHSAADLEFYEVARHRRGPRP